MREKCAICGCKLPTLPEGHAVLNSPHGAYKVCLPCRDRFLEIYADDDDDIKI